MSPNPFLWPPENLEAGCWWGCDCNMTHATNHRVLRCFFWLTTTSQGAPFSGKAGLTSGRKFGAPPPQAENLSTAAGPLPPPSAVPSTRQRDGGTGGADPNKTRRGPIKTSRVRFLLVPFKNRCYFPRLILKGIYHYWKSVLFVPGDLSNGLESGK